MLTKLKNSIKTSLYHLYTRIKYYYPIWLFLNRSSRSKFKNNIPKINSTQSKIIKNLKETGIAVTSLEALFPEENMLKTLQTFEHDHQKEKRQYHNKKKFLTDYWEKIPELNFKNPFIKIAISQVVLDIINSYMEMYSEFIFTTLQATDVIRDGGREFSQNWHRDPQEQKYCKMFIYLNNVDGGAGPFMYLPQSTHGHKYEKLFSSKPPLGSYPSEKETKKRMPEGEIKIMAGKAGTVIFCDTTGLHRGGYSTEKSRIMATFSYAAKTFWSNQRYWYSSSLLEQIKDSPKYSYNALRKKWIRK